MIATIAAHQILALRRRRALGTLFGVIIGVNVLAGVLGWASRATISGVYNESVNLLKSRGLAAPPNPFLRKPSLSLLANEIIYVTMIGALVALVLGHLVVAEDETGAIGRLVFSRQISRMEFAVGKITSVAEVLGAAMLGSAGVSMAALVVVNRAFPSAGDVTRLVGFFTFSWVYLMFFALIGMLTLLLTRRRSLGLLSALGAWLVVTFVVPQFTSGLRPSQSLNPIVDPISTSQTFFKITAKARPFSLAEQFKATSGRILGTTPKEMLAHTIIRALPILFGSLLLALTVTGLITIHDYARSSNEQSLRRFWPGHRNGHVSN